MFAIPAFLLGACLGVFNARRLGGTRADMAQYGIAYGLLFFLLALGLTILADWQGWL